MIETCFQPMICWAIYIRKHTKIDEHVNIESIRLFTGPAFFVHADCR